MNINRERNIIIIMSFIYFVRKSLKVTNPPLKAIRMMYKIRQKTTEIPNKHLPHQGHPPFPKTE